LAYLEMWAK